MNADYIINDETSLQFRSALTRPFTSSIEHNTSSDVALLQSVTSLGAVEDVTRARSQMHRGDIRSSIFSRSLACNPADRIEGILTTITSCLLDTSSTPVIHLKCRPSRHMSSLESSGEDTNIRTISFPGRTKEEAWRFSVVIRILSLILEALKTHTVTTKRDIYYKDPALFLKQSVVDRYVDDIAYTFGVHRASLNVAAAAKGLCAGSFVLRRADGLVVDKSHTDQAILIPEIVNEDVLETTDANFILVIEKEATFHSLLSSSLGKSLLEQGIILTGKGYPDIATRSFLHRLSKCPRVDHPAALPIYALVDYDPDGISILSTYKHGSKALPHENDKLVVPSLRWLGLTSDDVMWTTTVDKPNSTNEEGTHTQQGLLRLSDRDRRRAISMLKWPQLSEERSPSCRRELQVMLMLDVKAEIQVLDSAAGGLQYWLARKLNIT